MTKLQTVIDNLPPNGSRLRELQAQYPEISADLGQRLKDAARKGQVYCDTLNDRWKAPMSNQSDEESVCAHDGCEETFPKKGSRKYCDTLNDRWKAPMSNQSDEESVCAHDGCEETFPKKGSRKYCADHNSQLWHQRRYDAKKRGRPVADLPNTPPPQKPGNKSDTPQGHVTEQAPRNGAGGGVPHPPAPERAIATALDNLRAKAVVNDSLTTQSALDTQVGGDHYKSMKIQPAVFAEANRLTACEFAIVKYICRHRVKGGRLDLQKARHFVDMLEELTYGPETQP